jgi:drug/metabolite transporter (DMT)-like permease
MMFAGIALQQSALLYTQVANAAFLTALYVPAVPIFLLIFLRQPVASRIWLALILSLGGSWLLSGTTNLLSQWGDFLVATGALFWAGHIILIGLVMTKLKTPFQFAFVQNCLCVLFGLLPTYLIETPQLSDFLPVLPELFYAGLFSVGIAYTLQMVAQGYASTTLAAFILSLESVFAAISGWLLLGQNLSWLAISGCALIFSAIIIADVLPAQWLGHKRVKQT